jgi:exopolyphosphatase / guanosine-5'-triphosphate,3'-diphosphate pyrophosphatase
LGERHFKSHFAGIDIGSHTTRMIVVRVEGKELIPVRTERRITRLARNFEQSEEITAKAQERNITALKEYAGMLRILRVQRIACGATGVVRRARNSDAVLERIASETGIKAQILSEEKEAFLSAKAMLSVLPQREDDFLLFDIGGGSTEFLLATSGGREPAWSESLPFGAATLTEAFLSRDPPGTRSVEDARSSIRKEILASKEQMHAALAETGIISFSDRLQLAGTAGTVTTLAAMHLGMPGYDPSRVNGLVLTEKWLSKIILTLAAMPLIERLHIPGLEPGREDIILGGASIVSEILACFTQDRLMVSDAGLLQGLVLELIEKEAGLPGGLRTSLTWRLQQG